MFEKYAILIYQDQNNPQKWRIFEKILGCCGYGSKGNSVRSEAVNGGMPGAGFLYYQIPRRDCVIIPGLYASVNNHFVQFSDICGNAGLGGSDNALIGNYRTGTFTAAGPTTDERTLCSK